MDNLRMYLDNINLFYYELKYDNIINEYLMLENLCDNTLFYSKTRVLEVSKFDITKNNVCKTLKYYSEKIRYLNVYFNNLSNLDVHLNKIMC